MKNKSAFQNISSKTLLLFLGVILVVAFDQITKYLAIRWVAIEAGGLDWITFVDHRNYGISFGIELPSFLATSLVILFLIILLYLFFMNSSYSHVYYLGLVISIGGGFSNLIDRLILGFVRDFISISYLPIFNLADIAIVIGVSLIIVGIFGYNRDEISKT